MSLRKSRSEYQEIRSRETENKNLYFQGDGEALPPHTICLSVNNNCFMRCKMCDIGAANQAHLNNIHEGFFSDRYLKDRKYREFPLERIKGLIDEMEPHQPIFKTNFVEPLVYKPLKDLATYVKSKGLKYYTITNGWLLKKHAPWLVEIQADVLRVSLDGTSDIHDAIRGKKGSFQRTLEGLKEVIRIKRKHDSEFPILGVCYTISNYNYFNIVDFMESLRNEDLLDEVYVNFNHLQYTTNWEVECSKKESDLFTDLKVCSTADIIFQDFDIESLKSQIEKLYARFDVEKYHYYFSPWLKGQDLAHYYDPDFWMFPRTPCYLPWYAAQIDIQGDVTVYGHCILPSFGNILENSFMEVWNSDKAKDIRRRLKAVGSFPGCNNCIGTLYPLCGRE